MPVEPKNWNRLLKKFRPVAVYEGAEINVKFWKYVYIKQLDYELEISIAWCTLVTLKARANKLIVLV